MNEASFVTQGAETAAISLRMGVNDFGSVMLEENVVSAAGCSELVPLQEMETRIREAGFTPRQRNQRYDIIDSRGPVVAGTEVREEGRATQPAVPSGR